MTRRRITVALWAAPALLAVATAVGLVSALFGDDAWDVLSWGLLAMPVVVCLWFGVVRRAVRS